ncbi:hypothetical protein ABIC64_001088 [Plantibacter flavus]
MTDRRMVMRRRTVVRLLVTAGLVLLAVLLVRACAPMTIAAIGAKAAVEAVLGDQGTVTVRTIEPKINVVPMCELRVSVHEGATSSEVGDMLATIVSESDLAPCEVSALELANGSTLLLGSTTDFAAEQWSAIAAHLGRGRETISVRREDAPASVVPRIAADSVTRYLDVLRSLTAGARLEDSIGPVVWKDSWSLERAPFHAVDIDTDGTPPAELITFLQALEPVLSTTPTAVNIRHQTSAGGPVTRVELLIADAVLEERITTAFADSGLPGTLNIAYRTSAPLD